MNAFMAAAGLSVLGAVAAAAAGNLVPSDWADRLPSTQAEQWSVSRSAGPGGEAGVRFSIRKPTDPFYQLQIGHPLRAAIPADHRLALTFMARSPTRNPVKVVVEQSGPPWRSAASFSGAVSGEWAAYGDTQTVEHARSPGELSVRVQVGFQAGELEIAALRVEDLGPDPAVAAARAAVEPAAVEARIRRYRQADYRIRVVDADGRPVPGATVRVEQTNHAFLFGCNAFLIDPSVDEPWQRAYQETFAALMNFATLPFYWGSYERERGRKAEEKLEAMARWCAERGIAAKGHPLCWHEVWPRWAPKTADETIPLLRARVEEIIPKYKPWIAYWDVWNEVHAAAAHPDTGLGQWVLRDGVLEPVRQALGWARAAARDGGRILLYNDFNVSPANERLVEALAASAERPDAIGIQSHMHGGVWPPARVWAVTERFARSGLPLHYTEATVLSGDGKPRQGERHAPGEWPTVPEGEAKQAEYTESFYRLLFSHPSVEAITWWDFSDLRAWKGAPAGLVRADMSPKPAYDRLLRLIRDEWWTRAEASTDPDGIATVRAYRGAHRILASAAFAKASADAELPLRGDDAVELELRLR